MRTILKREFGSHVSEGQRQLWLALVERDCTQKELGVLVGAQSGLVNRWLYGEGKPGGKFLPAIVDELGIELRAWNRLPAGKFPIEEIQQLYTEWRKAA